MTDLLIFTKFTALVSCIALALAVLADVSMWSVLLIGSRKFGGFGIFMPRSGWVTVLALGWALAFAIGWIIARKLQMLPAGFPSAPTNH
jgi:hypothetical protein